MSIFKWEYRKGWDVLLKSYLTEFSQADSVTLYLLTNPYHTETDFSNKILEFLKNSGLKRPATDWASVYVIDSLIHVYHRFFFQGYISVQMFLFFLQEGKYGEGR